MARRKNSTLETDLAGEAVASPSIAGVRIHKAPLTSLAKFFESLGGLLPKDKEQPVDFWYRGQGRNDWELRPSAFRYDKNDSRDEALELIDEFVRFAPAYFNQQSLPLPEALDRLQWLGLGQHYGLPTRLIDWATNPAVALFFAASSHPERDGGVYLLNPADLNMASRATPRILNAVADREDLERYLDLDASLVKSARRTALRTVAVRPFHNSPRIHAQQGVFTLHGNTSLSLTTEHVSSLVVLPVLAKHKATLRAQLAQIGITQHSLFPEPAELCAHLKVAAGLPF